MHLLQFGLRLLESRSIFNEGVTPVKEERAEIVAPGDEKNSTEQMPLSHLGFVSVSSGEGHR